MTPTPATRIRSALLALGLALSTGSAATAQTGPFAPGWELQSDDAVLRFQSIKNGDKVESSGFATINGAIDDTGLVTLRVLLDSVDTKIDLRNVRMRFLFFETFQFPEAKIELRLTHEMVADLAQTRRKRLTLPYTLELHGVSRDSEAEVIVTLIDADHVSITSSAPIPVLAKDFGLSGGIEKLQEAAGVEIVPLGTVSFDFGFARVPGTQAPQPLAAARTPAAAALEQAGDFDAEACLGRFEILSRSGNIHFGTASARLDDRSRPLLDNVVDIVRRCPGMVIEVAGHTDSDGSDANNTTLSQRRAGSVADYLIRNGIEPGRIVTVGYGESRPIVANDTPHNKSRNRRIEFAVRDG